MSRPGKKRALEDSLALTTTGTHDASASSFKARNPLPLFVLQQQVETLQAELDHERSMRRLDQDRARQAKERLERQLEIAAEEAAQSTKSLTDFQEQSERITSQLREARFKALEELRSCQLQLQSEEEPDDSAAVRLWEEKCGFLERQLEDEKEGAVRLRSEMDSLRSEIEEKMKEREEIINSNASADDAKILSEATPEVLKELNSVRLALADAQREDRQLKRKVEDLQSRNKILVQEREEARLRAARLPAIEENLEELRKAHETTKAQNIAWNNFGDSLEATLNIQRPGLRPTSGPPEVSKIERLLEDALSKTKRTEARMSALQEDYGKAKKSIAALEAKVHGLESAELTWNAERNELETKLDASRLETQTCQAQQAIFKREADNLRTLIKTFDDLPLASQSPDTLASPKLDTSKKTLELTLSSTRDELELSTQEKERLSKELNDSNNELSRVKEKFGKLREALHAERAKAELAEQRANDAEALAGKGSFNPDTSRVLHFKETPLSETLKEEVALLKRQLEEAKGDGASQPSHNADKLNKRLKENFKEQISLFREGVYLMTGYKVDMLPGTDRPTFRVRSMYGEKEEDQFMLKWPKGEHVKSLDILSTDFAKVQASTPSYQYMTKFHSLPAFLASVQLSLFEKQTVMM